MVKQFGVVFSFFYVVVISYSDKLIFIGGFYDYFKG